MRGADDFGARHAQPLQGVEADGVGRQQVGQVEANRSSGAGARAAQFMHLGGVEPAGELNRASVSLFLDLNAALHAALMSKVGTIATYGRPCDLWRGAHHGW